MQYAMKSLGGVSLLEIGQDIDHSTAREFHDAMRAAMGEDGRLVLDLAGCRYIDSGGLAVLLTMTRDLDPGGWLGVVGGNRNIQRLFHLVGLDDEPGFHHFPDLRAAERELVSEVS